MEAVEQLKQFGARDALFDEKHDEDGGHKGECEDDTRGKHHVALHWHVVELSERLIDRVIDQPDGEAIRVVHIGSRKVRESPQTHVA